MPRYAIAFDLDTVRMDTDGLTSSQRTQIYQREIPNALAACGFRFHIQGSIYHTDDLPNSLNGVMALQTTLQAIAPGFCRYASSVHIFRMEEWSDVTNLVVAQPVTQAYGFMPGATA